MFFSRRDFLHSVGCTGAAALSTRTARSLPLKSSLPASNQPIRLDKNESAYGPSAKVAEAVRRACEEVDRYPRQVATELVERIAQYHNVDPAGVLLGDGSTELLRAACAAFCSDGRILIQPAPTYQDVEVYARAAGAQVFSVPLTRRFQFDFDGMLSHAGRGLAYICNPNNPTAMIAPRRDIESFISRLPPACIVLIDEAYHEYCPPSGATASFLNQPLNDDRVIVTRTFSLAYGLAGLRVGYAIASVNAIDRMRPFLTQNGVNTVALQAATAALEDSGGLAETVRRNAEARQEFRNQCLARSLKPLDSHTNFYAFNIFNPANLIIRYFREQNVLIAPVSLSWDTYLRVSLGRPEEMKLFWQLWDKAPIDKSSIPH